MSEPDFTGLGQAAQAAFKPSFAEVQRRARRRQRRTWAAGGSVLVAALAAGFGFAAVDLTPADDRGPAGTLAPGLEHNPPFIPSPSPSRTSPPDASESEFTVGRIVAGDLRHLYARYRDCRTGDCAIAVAASTDGGASWQTRSLPVPGDSLTHLRAVGPRTLVVWVQARTGARLDQYWLASSDGAVTWRRVEVRDVAASPPGYLALDPLPGLDSLRALAVDPVSGELVRPAEPVRLRHARLIERVPVEAGMWVTGYTDEKSGPAQQQESDVFLGKVTYSGSAVAVSQDGGRNWHQTKLPADIRAGEDFGAADLAISSDAAYAVGQREGELYVYRSTDQGRSWRRTAARARVDDRSIAAAVRPDGALVIQAGLQATEEPLMFLSTDRGESLREVPVGPGASAVAVGGGHVQSGTGDDLGVWLSTDGISWSYVPPPVLA